MTDTLHTLRDLGDLDLDPAARDRAEQRVAALLATPDSERAAPKQVHPRRRPFAFAATAVVIAVIAIVVVIASGPSDDALTPAAAPQIPGDVISDYSVFKNAARSVAADVRPGDRYALEHSGDGKLQAYAPVTFPSGSVGYAVATDKAFCILIRRPAPPNEPASPAGDIAGGSCSPRPSRSFPGTVLFRPQTDGTQHVFALYPDGVTGLTLTGDGPDRTITVRNNVADFRRPTNIDRVRVLANTDTGDQDTHIFGR